MATVFWQLLNRDRKESNARNKSDKSGQQKPVRKNE